MNIALWGATILHITGGELSSAITTAILLVMVTFVAYALEGEADLAANRCLIQFGGQ